MRDVIIVAQNTFNRIARIKSLYFILAACVVIIGAMGLYDTLSVNRADIMMMDAALAFMLIVGLVTAISAAYEIPRELQNNTAQLMLTKPLGRTQFVVGKFLGMAVLAFFNIALVAIGSMVMMRLKGMAVPQAFIGGCLLAVAEAVVLTGVAILLSSFLKEALAAVLVFVVFVVGHAIYALPAAFPAGFMHQISLGISYILPNLTNFDFKATIANGRNLSQELVLFAIGYAVAYTAAVVAAAVAIFQRRDIAK